MIEADKRNAAYLLHQEGMSAREIARRLGLSRTTVRSIIKQKGAMPDAPRSDKQQLDEELLRRLYQECDGFIQRVHEKLTEEEDVEVKYSTLTRMLRDLGIRRPAKDRCDRVPDEPGVEMQHDTTVYHVMLGDKRVRVIASLLYLRYSKRRYLRFYRAFNRFKMKGFFHEALLFWGYAAVRCVIDNTNLARLRGTGRNAVIVPEMEAFSKQYGFRFRCHEKGHANRKAGEERSFYTVETNFLPGRTFESLEDLNTQALEWATTRMDHRPQGKARLIPAKAFEHEREYLVKLPPHLPAPYNVLERTIDQYGYVAFAGNYYWVPGLKREDIRVLEYADRLKIFRRRELLIEYPLPPDGVKNKSFSPEGHPKPRHHPKNRRKPTAEEEKRLRAIAEEVGAYLDFVLETGRVQRHRFIRELFALAQQVTAPLFLQALARAHRYRITAIDTIRRIVHLCMTEGCHELPLADVDDTFRDRDAYRDGHLTDAPDLSLYDKLLENERDDDGEHEHRNEDEPHEHREEDHG